MPSQDLLKAIASENDKKKKKKRKSKTRQVSEAFMKATGTDKNSDNVWDKIKRRTEKAFSGGSAREQFTREQRKRRGN